MTADEIADKISARYAMDRGWAVLREVMPFPVRGHTTRRYDALALSMWGSLGVVVHGFEIKTAKADWQAEMLNPAKSAPLAIPCDYWWVVAPREVVDHKVVPPGWGVLHAVGAGLRVAVQAPKREPVRHETFWQCMLARLATRTDKDNAVQLRALTVRIRADEAKSVVKSQTRSDSAYENLKAQVDAFEKLSGLTLAGYTGAGEKAATLARSIANGDHRHAARSVGRAVDELKRALVIAERLRDTMEDG